MIECFVSCCLPDYAVFRCKLGELLEEEIEVFEDESNINNFPEYVLHKKGISLSLETLKERLEHKKALKKFKDYCSERKSFGHEYCFFPDDLVPHIDRMVEFITLARDIIELRKSATIITHSLTGQASADYPRQTQGTPSVPIEPSITPSTTDFAVVIDIADSFDETKYRLVPVKDFLNHEVNSDKKRPSKSALHKARATITWSTKNPGLGQDTMGNFLKREGNTPQRYRYSYYLPKQHDKKLSK